MAGEVTREEFTGSMERVHGRIDKINNSSIRMEEASRRIEESVSRICKEIDGNGRDGLKTKVSNIFTVLRIHFWLIALIVAGLISTAWLVIRKGV